MRREEERQKHASDAEKMKRKQAKIQEEAAKTQEDAERVSVSVCLCERDRSVAAIVAAVVLSNEERATAAVNLTRLSHTQSCLPPNRFERRSRRSPRS